MWRWAQVHHQSSSHPIPPLCSVPTHSAERSVAPRHSDPAYLTSSALNHDLGHVHNVAQGRNVISLPAPDGLRQDLQFQFLPFPYFLTLGLRHRTPLLEDIQASRT